MSVAFGGTEWLFVRLGVYESYWWKIPYTVVLFTVFFVFARFWFHKSLWWNLGAVLYSIIFEYALEQQGVIDIFVRDWVYYFVQFGCSLLVVVFLFYLNRWLMHFMSAKVPGIA